MDWTKKFLIKNVSGGRLVTGALSVPHGHEKELEPTKLPDEVVESLKKFAARGDIEVTNEYTIKVADGKLRTGGDLLKSQYAEKDLRAIAVGDAASINEGSIFKIENNTDMVSGAIQVDYSELDRIEAREFLAQHWKRVETEISKITNLRKLEFYLEVALIEGVTDRKIEAIKERINAL